jgi:hypothetical protein
MGRQNSDSVSKEKRKKTELDGMTELFPLVMTVGSDSVSREKEEKEEEKTELEPTYRRQVLSSRIQILFKLTDFTNH